MSCSGIESVAIHGTDIPETADPKLLDTACVAKVRRKPWVLRMADL
jgi:hypothetical protein